VHRLLPTARTCARAIENANDVLIVSHIDADGISAASIAGIALENAGIDHEVRLVRSLDDVALKSLPLKERELVLFCDLGSSAVDKFEAVGIDWVVLDHHRTDAAPEKNHLNPHMVGIDGSYEVSGAGLAYMVAREMGCESRLSTLAVVGALGDLQSRRRGKLVSVNAAIVDEGVKAGCLKRETDLRFFGRQTRPLVKLLQYTSDTYLPGITGNEAGCHALVAEANVRLTDDGGRWRRWVDLNDDERQAITSALLRHGLSVGVPADRMQQIVGETYVLTGEAVGTAVRDAQEFSSLLNATARYDRGDIGLSVCRGDRGLDYQSALALQEKHRRNLVNGLNLVRETGTLRRRNLQFFHAHDQILETIVGIIAGMSFSLPEVDRGFPVVYFADDRDGKIKVSGRATAELVSRGLDLASALTRTAEAVGGVGGGHDIAAGATIPRGEEERFLDLLDRVIGEQLGTC